MDWSDEAIVLGARRHGEGGAIVTVFTPRQGLHSGLLHSTRKAGPAGLLEPGTRLQARWRGRLADHLGTFTLEAEDFLSARLMAEPKALTALAAASTTLINVLPERDPQPGLYEAFRVLLQALEAPSVWPAVYVRWELGLLEALGFGLDLSRCAATGATGGGDEPLTHVSPKSGRAVGRAAAQPYLDKLLRLPPFLLSIQMGAPEAADIADGLALTRYFLERDLFAPQGRPLPLARQRLETLLAP